MHFSTHLLASALAGAALYRRSPLKAALVAVAGVVLDIDHYLLYAARSGDWNPIGALRYNRRRARPYRPGDTRPRYGSLRSVAHRPSLTIPAVWLLSYVWPACQPVAVGLTLHLLMDFPWSMTLDWRVWRRAHGHCERCGATDRPLGVYHVVMPRFGGDPWALENRAAWCERCAALVRREQQLARSKTPPLVKGGAR